MDGQFWKRYAGFQFISRQSCQVLTMCQWEGAGLYPQTATSLHAITDMMMSHRRDVIMMATLQGMLCFEGKSCVKFPSNQSVPGDVVDMLMSICMTSSHQWCCCLGVGFLCPPAGWQWGEAPKGGGPLPESWNPIDSRLLKVCQVLSEDCFALLWAWPSIKLFRRGPVTRVAAVETGTGPSQMGNSFFSHLPDDRFI